MKPTKLLWQIYPATLVAVLATIVAVTWYGSVVFRDFYLKQSAMDLEARANLIKSRVHDYLETSNYLDLRDFCKSAGRSSGTRITIVDRQGRVLADSNENPENMDNHGSRPEILAAYDGERGRSLRFSKTLGERLLYIAIPLLPAGTEQAADGQASGTVIRVSVPVTSLDNTIAGLQWRVVGGCVFIIIAIALVSLFIARNISRPLEEMTRTAEQFSRGDFSQKLSPTMRRTSSLEVSALAASMARMAEMLDDKIKTIVSHRNQLETVFASMVESVVAVDNRERIISINRAAASLLGVSREVAQGKVIQEIIRHSQLLDQVIHTLKTSESIEDEITYRTGAGSRELYLQVRVRPLDDGKDRGTGVLLVMNDVTHLRRLERIRRDFVANVSHELRTPITSIRGYVETLLDGALDSREDSRRFLAIVLRQSEQLTAIIDDLLALSRIEQESSNGKIDKTPGPLCSVIAAAIEVCQVKAEESGVQLSQECPEGLFMAMNATLIEQALVNLLVNGIKYSKTGDTVLVRVDSITSGRGAAIQITVRDTGCGIAPEHLPRLFERFYRSDKARSRNHGGTGLGLAIVKHIVQAHGGSVEVTSELGQGSSFILTFPG